MYAKAVEVASDCWSSCVDSADPGSGPVVVQVSSSENSAGCSGDGVDSSGRDDDASFFCCDLSAFSGSVRRIL